MKRICSFHFDDYAVKNFIKNNARFDYCDFCEESDHSMDFDDLCEFIKESIYYEYVEPYEAGAPYNPEEIYYEDRFIGVSVHYTRDLIAEYLETFDNFEIIEEISDTFEDDHLTLKEAIYGPTEAEYLIAGWSTFKDVIKHRIRFLFFDNDLIKTYQDKWNESLNPVYVLDEVTKAVVELSLIENYDKGSLSIYRTRQHLMTEIVSGSKELGSPPARLAKANRMSPPGISMFYGALDVFTSELEVIDDQWKNSVITTGEFLNTNSLKLINLTNIRDIPSIFDADERDKRSVIAFLSSFVKDLQIPVQPDNLVHIDYIPTQVVTEFFKVKLGKEYGVNGILYNSVKNTDGVCLVLFTSNDQMKDLQDIRVDDESLVALIEESVIHKILV